MAADCQVACERSGLLTYQVRKHGVLLKIKDQCGLCTQHGRSKVRMVGKKKKIALPARVPSLSGFIVDSVATS